MAGRQCHELIRSGDEEWTSRNQERTRPRLSESSKRGVDVGFGADSEDGELLPHGARRGLYVIDTGLSSWIVGVYEEGDHGGGGHQLPQQSDLLSPQREQETGHA